MGETASNLNLLPVFTGVQFENMLLHSLTCIMLQIDLHWKWDNVVLLNIIEQLGWRTRMRGVVKAVPTFFYFSFVKFANVHHNWATGSWEGNFDIYQADKKNLKERKDREKGWELQTGREGITDAPELSVFA